MNLWTTILAIIIGLIISHFITLINKRKNNND
nr:MAG TPA: toxin [Bacteriophage sp.]DAZ57207.1 MAG TPA: toxin [Caudoviricetes sp.]